MHAILFKVFCLVMGLACVVAGCISIRDREAKLSWGEDGYKLVEGFPAILVGVGEIAMGVYVVSMPYLW